METMELQQILNTIPDDRRNLFLMEYNGKQRNSTTAVLLAVLFGGVGAHHFYMGNIGLGVVYIIFSWSMVPLILGIIEAFLMPARVRNYNMARAREIAVALRASAGGVQL